MKDNLYQKFKSNMARLDGLYKEHRMTTNEAVHLFKDESLDGVFIDADHSYEAVKKDIADWIPKIRRGGILAGHDYIQTFGGVVQAVNESFPNMDFMVGEQCWIKQC
jgi:predicted O-methyltransferase YrrM